MKLSYLYESEDLTFGDWRTNRQQAWDINMLKRVQRKYPPVDLSKLRPDDTVIVFHGTTTTLLPQISRKGLVSMSGNLSVTTDITYTDQWMEEASWERDGDEILLGIILQRSQLKINEELATATEEGYPITGAFVISGRIPPNKLFVITKDGNRTPIKSYSV